ncbi:hypothetical protein ACWDBW_16710 [Streptomyces sp. NPDC001107]
MYQAQGNQYISHLHLHEEVGGSARELVQAGMRGAALEMTQERVSLLIRTLSLTQAELQARCVELEEEARQARAEGRAEALAAMQEQLQAAELRIMKTQETMCAAVREREKAEALLTQAQEELALRRRAEERREEERARDEARARPQAGTTPPEPTPSEEDEQFTEFLERAEAQLGQVRDDLRLLGDEISGQDGTPAAQVIEGQVVRQPRDLPGQVPKEAKPAPGITPAATKPEAEKPSGSEAKGGGKTAATTARPRRTPVPGPPRRLRIGWTWLFCTLPPWFPMLVITSNRAAYASEAAFWKQMLFTVLSIFVGAVLYVITVGLAASEVYGGLDRDSEHKAGAIGVLIVGAGTTVSFVIAFWTPLTWLGPAGEWGKWLAAASGLG